jgi:hypothetical protein
MRATGERVRELASDSQPSGNPPREAGMRGASTCSGSSAVSPSHAGISGKLSPFRVRSTISVEAAAPDQAIATDLSIVTAMETIARSTLQPSRKRWVARPIKPVPSNVCGNMISIPRMMENLTGMLRPGNSDNFPPGNSGGRQRPSHGAAKSGSDNTSHAHANALVSRSCLGGP